MEECLLLHKKSSHVLVNHNENINGFRTESNGMLSNNLIKNSKIERIN